MLGAGGMGWKSENRSGVSWVTPGGGIAVAVGRPSPPAERGSARLLAAAVTARLLLAPEAVSLPLRQILVPEHLQAIDELLEYPPAPAILGRQGQLARSRGTHW